MKIGPANIDQADVQELIMFHRQAALAANTVCEGHAMTIDDYRLPDLQLFEAREGDDLLGICGLLTLSSMKAELKTMHTRHRARGRGIGQVLLTHVIHGARGKGFTEIYLETGTSPFFSAATRLYYRLGFQDCAAFANYVPNPDSRFMVLKVEE